MFAPVDGTIIRTSDPVGGPNGIWIENTGSDLRVRLMHMDALAPAIATGTRVQAGQWVGVLGGQGTEDFPHLHVSFERLSTGECIDPARFYFRPNPEMPMPIARAAYRSAAATTLLAVTPAVTQSLSIPDERRHRTSRGRRRSPRLASRLDGGNRRCARWTLEQAGRSHREIRQPGQ